MSTHELPGVVVTHEDRDLERERSRVYRLTIRHPGKINVLGASLVQQLNRALDRVADDPQSALVVLTGGGRRAFIGGADIRELASLDAKDGSARRFIQQLHGVCRRLRSLDVPVIARIDGYCLGAGLEIAASCDLRVATRESRFGMPEVLVGIPSVIEAALLPRLIGWGATSDILLTGRMFDASEAKCMGLIDRLVGRAELESGVEQVVLSLLAAGPRALASQKQLFQIWQEQPLAESIQAGVDSFEESFESDEPARYLGAFLQRRESK